MKKQKQILNVKSFTVFSLAAMLLLWVDGFSQITYPIVETNQDTYFDTIKVITAPTAGSMFYGQDAQYTGNQPNYTDNGDGTVTDNVSGLMWQKSPDLDGDGDIDYDDKLSYEEALDAADTFSLAGYSDWRLPSIKEMYSLIMFSGEDPSSYSGTSTSGLVPFIDTNYFDFAYGDQNAGERIIDAQMASSTLYVSTTMNGNETMFGVNFADGRIKGYPTSKAFYIMYVRGNTDYGINNFVDNGDQTITDKATGLMWAQNDNGASVPWQKALGYAENATIAGYSDWRLPNAKELQSIVDYTRAPDITNSAAIDPLFNCSKITDEGGNDNYAFYWTGTTHISTGLQGPGANAAYVAFGEALGFLETPENSGNYTLMDVHGAGAQRSDPKVGNPADYPYGHGPQGDVIRIFNFVRLVRDVGTSSLNEINYDDAIKIYPNPAGNYIKINLNEIGSGISNLKIINTLGEIVYSSENETSDVITINTQNLKSGMYVLTIEINDMIYNKKFMRN